MASKGNAKGKTKGKEKDSKSSIIVILVLLCIGVIAFFGITYQVVVGGSKETFVKLSPIKTSLNSGGKEHQVSLDISLGGKSKDLKKLNMQEVQNVAQETISSLDYEKLVGKDGSDYVKQSIKQNLNSQFGEKVDKVTIDSFLTDVSIGSQTEETSASRQDYLDGISWTKKK